MNDYYDVKVDAEDLEKAFANMLKERLADFKEELRKIDSDEKHFRMFSDDPKVEEKMIKDYGKHFLYTLSWFTVDTVLDDPQYDEFL
tara:strand:+ start:132 stop:392 length:261 start_codon:yes stop_codon:yes gene_type:complete